MVIPHTQRQKQMFSHIKGMWSISEVMQSLLII